jgi:hypothetical protein
LSSKEIGLQGNKGSLLVDYADKENSRRKYDRLPIVVLCDISDPLTGEILGKGCVLNYSRGGLSVGTSAILGWDAMVNLNVNGLLQEGFLSVKIVNSRTVMDDFYAYGMEFRGLNPLKRIQMERKFKKLFQTLIS